MLQQGNRRNDGRFWEIETLLLEYYMKLYESMKDQVGQDGGLKYLACNLKR